MCVCVCVCVCVFVCLSITAVTYTNELMRRAVVIRVVIVRSKSTAHTWRRGMGGTMKEYTVVRRGRKQYTVTVVRVRFN